MAPAVGPLQSISKVSNLWANAQGDHMYVKPTVTDHLMTFVIGMRDYNPFANAKTGAGQGTAIADREDDPIASREVDGPMTLRSSTKMVDLDVADVATWNLDGFFPSLYLFTRASASGGWTDPATGDVIVNSSFAGTNADDWTDRPIFNGGLDAITVDYPACTYASSTTQTGATNPVVKTPLSLGLGSLVLVLVVMKSGNAIGDVTIDKTSDNSHTQTLAVIDSGKCVGTEAHWVLVGGDAAASDCDEIRVANPLGYELSFVAGIFNP